ncbi:GATS protein-like 3 [Mortierella sp. 14UC]|nr:GATS protein-like 3 [Mortierella sp. 14UC]
MLSIFYMSTYQTDLLFVQEGRIPLVFKTLSANGMHMTYDEDMSSTPPDTPIPDQHCFWRHPFYSNEEEEPPYEHGSEMRDHPSFRANYPTSRELSEQSLATPPGSHDSGSEEDDEQERSSELAAVPMVSSHNGIKQLVPLDIYSAQRHGKSSGSNWSENFAGNEGGYNETMLSKASPTTTTAFEIRQQANRTLPENSLRCVGLNTDLEAGHQPWLLKIIKILFYHDKVKEQAILAGNGPAHDAPRFFSFTATSECVSMITDTYILKEFEEHELFMDMETCSYRLIQLDLHRFGLDKYGIIHSVARPLTEAGIELLFLSTFSTANILVADHRLSEAERILSGGGSATPGS